MSFCIKCGKPNLDNAKFCTSCGAALTVLATTPVPPQTTTSSKNRSTWIIIGIIAFLGLSAGAYFIFFNKKATTGSKGSETEITQALPGLYPYASQRFLTPNDISNLPQYNLRIMRNEIYARHGYIFQNTEMKNYFTSQPWYTPLYSNVTEMLSNIEKKNIELIKQYEKYNEQYSEGYNR